MMNETHMVPVPDSPVEPIADKPIADVTPESAGVSAPEADTKDTNVAPPSNQGDAVSIASLVLGIVSVTLCCIWFFTIPISITGLVLGVLGRRKSEKFDSLATAGFVLSIVGLILSILVASPFLRFLPFS